MPKYNLKKQQDDERDFNAAFLLTAATKLPASVDLRAKCPPVYDQGQLGSCTANAGCAARTMLLGDTTIMFSRIYQYFKERQIEGDIPEDNGAQMRDICKALSTYGVCLETTVPYDITKFAITPPSTADAEAIKYKVGSYHAVTSLDQIKQVLALRNQPVLLGMEVFESFESDAVAQTGKMPMPKTGEQSLGGHAVLAVGYIDAGHTFMGDFLNKILNKPSAGYLIVRNSWGSSWGDKGYFYMPYEYVTSKHAYDFWTLA